MRTVPGVMSRKPRLTSLRAVPEETSARRTMVALREIPMETMIIDTVMIIIMTETAMVREATEIEATVAMVTHMEEIETDMEEIETDMEVIETDMEEIEIDTVETKEGMMTIETDMMVRETGTVRIEIGMVEIETGMEMLEVALMTSDLVMEIIGIETVDLNKIRETVISSILIWEVRPRTTTIIMTDAPGHHLQTVATTTTINIIIKIKMIANLMTTSRTRIIGVKRGKQPLKQLHSQKGPMRLEVPIK